MLANTKFSMILPLLGFWLVLSTSNRSGQGGDITNNHQVEAFVLPNTSVHSKYGYKHKHKHSNKENINNNFNSIIMDIRGGATEETMVSSTTTTTTTTTALNSVSISTFTTTLPSMIQTALQGGLWGVPALAATASAVVIPLTLYRQGYSFSVGYGLSVCAMGLAVANSFNIPLLTSVIGGGGGGGDILNSVSSLSSLSWLTMAVIFYGARLGFFLLFRELTVPSKREQVKSFDKSPRLKRIPFGAAVALFYALLTSPLLFAARGYSDIIGTTASASTSTSSSHSIMIVGVGLAWLGAIMEAVADAQKYIVKKKQNNNNNGKEHDSNKESDDSKSTFVGPTGGFYRLCRHPNYLGEVLYWAGLVVAGLPSFGNNPIAWASAILGFYGIYGIMSGAAKRLDGNQKDKYSGQDNYDTYRKEVSASLWPWMQNP